MRAWGAALLSLMAGCAAQAPQSAAPRALGAEPAAEPSVPFASAPKACGPRADYPSRHAVSWVEDATQRLCCSPRGEGRGWRYVAPEDCVSRYAPGVQLPDVVEPSDGERPGQEACSPGVEALVLVPTSELEARLISGSQLRIESCLSEACAHAIVGFDSLARDDQLVLALRGEPAAGVSLAWRAGLVRLSVKVPQARETVVQGQRYRLSLVLDGKSLRAIDTTLDYTPAPSECPLARITLGAP